MSAGKGEASAKSKVDEVTEADSQTGGDAVVTTAARRLRQQGCGIRELAPLKSPNDELAGCNEADVRIEPPDNFIESVVEQCVSTCAC